MCNFTFVTLRDIISVGTNKILTDNPYYKTEIQFYSREKSRKNKSFQQRSNSLYVTGEQFRIANGQIHADDDCYTSKCSCSFRSTVLLTESRFRIKTVIASLKLVFHRDFLRYLFNIRIFQRK